LPLIKDEVTFLLFEWYGRGRETVCQDEKEIGEHCKAVLVLYNSRLAARIAGRYVGRGFPFDDLFEEGVIGLIRAIEKFDLKRGCKFSTYATWWIRQTILRALCDKAKDIRLPVHVHGKLVEVLRARDELQQELGKEPTIEEIAERIGMSYEVVERILNLPNVAISLNEPVGEDGESERGDLIEDQSIEPLEEQIGQIFLHSGIWELTQVALTPREVKILEMRFGLRDDHPHTLEEIARAFSVEQDPEGEDNGYWGKRVHTTITRERIRQIAEEALEKLRERSNRPHTFFPVEEG